MAFSLLAGEKALEGKICMESTFPLLNEEMRPTQDRQSLVFDYRYHSLCYIYVLEHNDTWFVDIYVYYDDRFRNRIAMDRFIIAPGRKMSQKDEKRFLYFVKDNDVLFDTRTCDGYVNTISKVAPELNMKPYKDIGMALFHTYYASYWSGTKELLVKAGLEWIAYNLDDIEGLQTGNNIEEVFNMPIKLIRKFNWYNGVKDTLATEEKRKKACNVYKKYHSILNNIDFLNEFQIHYLMECIEQHEETVDKKLLVELGDLESGWDAEAEIYIDGYGVYEQLKEYQVLRGAMKVEHKTIFPPYPKLSCEELEKFFEITDLLKTYLIHEEEIEQLMRKTVWRCEKYLYGDEEYEILVPKSCEEIWTESEAQHNCLYQHLMGIAKGEMTVLFMRKKENSKQALVTIEISGNMIRQALSCCNARPSEKEIKFIEKFAKAKNLSYNNLEETLNDNRNRFIWNNRF